VIGWGDIDSSRPNAIPVLGVLGRKRSGAGEDLGQVTAAARGQVDRHEDRRRQSLGQVPRDFPESLDPSGAHKVGLKWPNDVWVNDSKLVGILIETALPSSARPDASRYLVIGIGVNIGARDADGMRTPPAWLRQWRPDASAPEVLGELAPPLVQAVLDFEARGFAPFAERFAARDVLRGREVALSDGTTGLCEGVAWGGELQVRTDAGLQLISSDEVSVRPRGMAF